MQKIRALPLECTCRNIPLLLPCRPFMDHQLHTNDQCLQYLFKLRYKDAACPKCGRKGSQAFHRHIKKQCYTCNCGRYHLYPRKGTIFERSQVPLPKWFKGISLMCREPSGVTCQELQKKLGISYRSAWRMKRKLLSVKPSTKVLNQGMSAAFDGFIRRAIATK